MQRSAQVSGLTFWEAIGGDPPTLPEGIWRHMAPAYGARTKDCMILCFLHWFSPWSKVLSQGEYQGEYQGENPGS